MPDYDPHAPKQIKTFDPFANDAATVAYYGGERVATLDTWIDKKGASLTTIQYADGSRKTVFTSQIFPQVR